VGGGLAPAPRAPTPPPGAPPPPPQSPNPWHVSFSYARALQNSVLRTWKGDAKNNQAGQEALLVRAKANSDAQLGKYDPSTESAEAGKSLYEKGYKY